MIIGIDATNIRGGGGVTHLVELLGAALPSNNGISEVVVWGCEKTLAAIGDREWLVKVCPQALNSGLLHRTFWQRFELSKAATAAGCNVLFIPGGSYAGNFSPVVTMSQNLLPFEWRELRRFGWTISALKLLFLRAIQWRSFRRSDGVVFLTEYARDAVIKVTGPLSGEAKVIPHGFNHRFNFAPRPQESVNQYTAARPFRVLYVSIINQYKHQWRVVEAIAQLRQRFGWPLTLDLVGPAYAPALSHLTATMRKFDPDGKWVRYRGAVPYGELHKLYAAADLGMFASSCENMPIILLETMGAGLPIACSRLGPMPEMLGEAGIFFHPEQPESIAEALRRLIEAPELRTRMAQQAFARAQAYSWKRCADETFGFLAQIGRRRRAG